MSHEEATEVESQQKTSINKESRENIPISTTAPKKSASHPSLQVQQSQNEQSSTAESSQEIKMNLGRKQKDKNKDILKSNNACQIVSGKDIINNNKSTSNGNTSSTTSNVNSGVDENSNGSFDHDDNISGGDTDHDSIQENGISIPRRQSMNDTPQKLIKSHSMHQRHNSTPNSSSINFITTNTSISVSPPSPSPSSSSSNDNNNNNDNTDQANANNNVNMSTTSANATYSNGMPPQVYEETPQMSYPNMNPNAPFMPVPSQYFPPFFLNNGQYFYDQYNRFGRPPPQIPPSAQQTFRSNVYPYHQIPVIPQMHPPPYHNPSPLISHQTLPTRYLNPSSATGGDSGFSSRRSSLDQVRTPDLGPQHPPRIHQQKKPKQLDKALWVGNLPDTTTQEELKEFFADENMESVFHIKKSNCAFVNYKTYDAVLEAVHKYNDIEFKGIKLVCRPRKPNHTDLKLKTESLSSLVSENTPPATPSEAGSTASSSTRSRRSSLPPRRIRQPSVASMSPASSVSSLKPSSQNRYFILKSLTQDDLDISVKSGLWATQPHNEAALNKAFKSAENVYLIFSANKSGEFYGYARMLSPISKETTETVQWTPIDEAALAASSSRLSPNQEESKLRKKFQDEENEDCEDDAVPSRNWGTTFKVEWIKVQKLPFIRTRQLRNPWNANREVKISRDGTEVEPVVGERLLAEFNKSPPITASYSNMSGPLLTQPLNIDGQVAGEGQDRMLATQNGAQMPPMMDPNFMPNAQPAYFTPPPGYWPPIIIPPYGAHPVPPGYVQAQQAWTTSSTKDQSRIQPTQPSTGVAGSNAMAPMMTLDQQQYVEVIWGHMPQQHPSHYPAPHLYQPGAGVHYHQAPPQQYYRSSEDNSHVDGPMTYQQQQENMGNDQESESHMVPSYLIEEQRQSVEASSNA